MKVGLLGERELWQAAAESSTEKPANCGRAVERRVWRCQRDFELNRQFLPRAALAGFSGWPAAGRLDKIRRLATRLLLTGNTPGMHAVSVE